VRRVIQFDGRNDGRILAANDIVKAQPIYAVVPLVKVMALPHAQKTQLDLGEDDALGKALDEAVIQPQKVAFLCRKAIRS
jgi:hypothetical protein